jgi:uncharacterized phage protein (TIGR02220 family)
VSGKKRVENNEICSSKTPSKEKANCQAKEQANSEYEYVNEDENTTKDYYYKEIVNYLNEKAGTQFKHTSEKTKGLIKARYNDGFTLENFYTVIDNKVNDWVGNAEYEKFLRPETLFSNKFEGYLNQKINKQTDNLPIFKPGQTSFKI